jgi:hypothetical protein
MDRQHERAGGVTERPTDVIMGVRAPVDEAAAVVEHDDRMRTVSFRVIRADRECAARSLDVEVVGFRDGRLDTVVRVGRDRL